MPLITGGSAHDKLEDGKGFDPLDATRIARSAARGLAAAHGGSLQVEAGERVAFTLTLPAGP